MNRQSFLMPRDPPLPPVMGADPPRASFVAFAAQRPLKAVEAPNPGGRRAGPRTVHVLLEGLRGAAADANARVMGRSLADWIRNALAARMTDRDRATSTPRRTRRSSRKTPGSCSRAASRDGSKRSASLFRLTCPRGLRGSGPARRRASSGVRDRWRPGRPSSSRRASTSSTRRTRACGTGSRSPAQPFGIFKLKTRVEAAGDPARSRSPAGRPRRALGRGADRGADPRNPATHECHEAGVEAAVQAATSLRAQGARAVLTVISCAYGGPTAGKAATPWRDIVVDAAGRMVIDLDGEGERHTEEDPYARCTKAIDPGGDFLRQRLQRRRGRAARYRRGRVGARHVLRRSVADPASTGARPRVSSSCGGSRTRASIRGGTG
jgi:hypothetical protein